jgi:GTPase SAR1 family protein
MSSTTDSDDPIPRDNIRLFSPNGVMKEIMLKILVIGDYGVGKVLIIYCMTLILFIIYQSPTELFIFFWFCSSGKTALVRRYTEGK